MFGHPSDYEELLNRLFAVNLHGGMKLGLSNIECLNQALNNPNKSFESIHVAGTNGKGSVATKIARALETEGFRVGLFTSPHISTFRERIKINNQIIEEKTTAILLQKIFKLADKEKIPATFFEITTALAFAYFAEQKVQYAVLETGLGGRLDATNIVIPKLSIITSISLEHTEFLGHTLEEITIEKAGIIKPNIPILIGPRVPKNVIKEIAKKKGSPLHQIEGHFLHFNDENSAIAKRALELLGISSKAIDIGLKALPPCRMEVIYHNPLVILDVGHNPDGLEHLFQSVKDKYPQSLLRVIFGLSKNKDIEACLNVLKKYGHHIHLVEARNGRGIAVDSLHKKMIDQGFQTDTLSINGNIQNTIKEAMEAAKAEKQIVIVCGTFFIMSEARAALGIDEPTDHFDINEK